MSKLAMNSEKEILLRHEFVCSGFIERTASWARLLCLVFLFLQLLATAVNLVYPFAVEPPPFYIQLLFFLLACAAFEIFAIPIESIKDHCIIDLQKTMVVKVYNRYFFTRVEVLATFDKIMTLGVSARPDPAIKGVFSESPRRFAILMLTEKGRVHRLTDYNLGLEEANRLLKSLHESYLRHTDIVYGAENIELCLDRHVDKSFAPRSCRRSWLTLVDAALLPAFQAVTGAAVVVVLISITTVVGDFVSERMFNTSLKIPYQPIFQIVIAPARPVSATQTNSQSNLTAALSSTTSAQAGIVSLPEQKSPSESPTEPALPLETSSKPEHLSATVDAGAASPAANLSQSATQQLSSGYSTTAQTSAQVVLTTISELPGAAASTPEPIKLADAFSSEPPPAELAVIVDHEEYDFPAKPAPEPAIPPTPVMANDKASTDTPAKEQVSASKTGKRAALIAVDTAEKSAETKIAHKAPATEKIAVKLAAVPILVPLPSRIPTFDETGIAVLAPAAENNAQPIRLHVPPQTTQKKVEKPLPPVLNQQLATAKIEQAAAPPNSYSTPDNAAAKDRLFDIPASKTAKKPGTPVRSTALKAPSYIGQNVEFAFDSLGKPLTSIKTAGGEQLIYSGITLLTDSNTKKIIQVNLTSQQNKTLGPLSTHEGLKVGSLVREAKERLGVPLQKANSRGLHFPARGVSVFPLPGDAETIGSIQIYQASAPTGH
jgi:hypothetical protein